jgi:hypothetical protein
MGTPILVDRARWRAIITRLGIAFAMMPVVVVVTVSSPTVAA